MNKLPIFNLTTPCKKCPFRKQGGAELREGRIEEIVSGLHDNEDLICHNTIDYDGQMLDEDGGFQKDYSKNMVCAGAMIYLEKCGNTNLTMRLGQLTGLYDPGKLHGHDEIIDPLGLDDYRKRMEWEHANPRNPKGI